MKKLILTLATAALCGAGFAAHAEGHATQEQLEGAVKARQSHMQLYAHNLGILGAMAQGNAEYDADAASAAAGNIAALAGLNQSTYWLPGTDSDSIEGSRALAAIWAADSKIGEAGAAFGAAVQKLNADAGTDLASLQAAMGDIGAACGGCHRGYRVRNN